MKFITDRKEIAKLINIDELPTVRIDISKHREGWERCYTGDKLVVYGKNSKLRDYGIRTTVEMYGDEENEGINEPLLYKRICLMPEAVCLHNGFGYNDAVDMYNWRTAQRANEGQEIVVMFDAGSKCYLRLMKVGKVADWVYPTAILEDVD